MRADTDELLTVETDSGISVSGAIVESTALAPKRAAKVSISKLPGTLIPVELYAPEVPEELIDAASRMMSTNQLTELQVRHSLAQYMVISDTQWGIVMSDPRMMHARGQRRRLKIEDARDLLAQTVIDQVQGLSNLADSTSEEGIELDARKELLKYGVQVSLAAEATHSTPTNIQVNVNNTPNEPTWQQRIRDNSVKNFDGGSTVIAVRTE